MFPVIKTIYTADVEDLATWKPDSLESTYIALEMTIGPKYQESGDLFQVTIATPQALQQRMKGVFSLLLRGYLVVSTYDWPQLQAHLDKIMLQCQGEDWAASAQRLSRYFLWDFEDYRA